jgi:hypothetical protein
MKTFLAPLLSGCALVSILLFGVEQRRDRAQESATGNWFGRMSSMKKWLAR